MKNQILVDINDPTKTVKIYLNNELLRTGTYSDFYEIYTGYGYSQSYRGYIDELKLNRDNCEIIIKEYKYA